MYKAEELKHVAKILQTEKRRYGGDFPPRMAVIMAEKSVRRILVDRGMKYSEADRLIADAKKFDMQCQAVNMG